MILKIWFFYIGFEYQKIRHVTIAEELLGVWKQPIDMASNARFGTLKQSIRL